MIAQAVRWAFRYCSSDCTWMIVLVIVEFINLYWFCLFYLFQIIYTYIPMCYPVRINSTTVNPMLAVDQFQTLAIEKSNILKTPQGWPQHILPKLKGLFTCSLHAEWFFFILSDRKWVNQSINESNLHIVPTTNYHLLYTVVRVIGVIRVITDDPNKLNNSNNPNNNAISVCAMNMVMI
jgi:hypothetical protein